MDMILKCGSRVGGGGRGSGPPSGKSQLIWVSIGNRQLDPPPWKKLDPPGKCWTPSGTLKNDRFLWNWPFDFCKLSWGLKKKKKKTLSELIFVRLTWTPPPPPPPPPPDENSWIRAWFLISVYFKIGFLIFSNICCLYTLELPLELHGVFWPNFAYICNPTLTNHWHV